MHFECFDLHFLTRKLCLRHLILHLQHATNFVIQLHSFHFSEFFTNSITWNILQVLCVENIANPHIHTYTSLYTHNYISAYLQQKILRNVGRTEDDFFTLCWNKLFFCLSVVFLENASHNNNNKNISE